MASFAIVRYLNNGQVDNAFADDGKLIISFDESVGTAATMAVFIGRNDTILVCGTIDESTIGIARVSSHGELDTDFGNGGKILFQFMEGQSEPIIRSIFFAETNSFPTPVNLPRNIDGANSSSPDLKIIVAGEVGRFSNTKFAAITCYDLHGQLDGNFGSNGNQLISFQVDRLQVRAAAYSKRQSKIILVAEGRINPRSNKTDLVIARLLSNGILDASFGNDGRLLALFALEGDSSSLAIDPHDTIVLSHEILIAGAAKRPNQTFGDMAVLSLNEFGGNTQFGNRGAALAHFSSASYSNSVTIDARGRIVSAGKSGNNVALARFLRTGRRDNTFGQMGEVTTSFVEGAAEINVVKIDSPIRERIVAAGVAAQQFALIRFLDNGALDHSFGARGRTRTVITDKNLQSQILDLAFDSQNRIVAVGSVETQSSPS